MSGVNRVARLRDDDVVNRLVTVDYSATGGGLDDQWYQEGCFALDDDEVLLVETPLDPGVPRVLAVADRRRSSRPSTGPTPRAASTVIRRSSTPTACCGWWWRPTDPGRAQLARHHRPSQRRHSSSGGRAPTSAPDVSVRVVAGRRARRRARRHRSPASRPEQRADAIRARQVGVQLRTTVGGRDD